MPSISKVVALDLDSVLADTMDLWCNIYNREYLKGYPFVEGITKKHITDWHVEKCLPIDEKVFWDIYDRIWTEDWRDIKPTEPNLPFKIHKMKQLGYTVSVITNSKHTIENLMWLDSLGIKHDDFVYVKALKKADYPFNILLDDGFHNIEPIKLPRIGVLFNQPWNASVQHVFRVDSIGQFIAEYLAHTVCTQI